MITQATVTGTYDDGSTFTVNLNGTPAVEAVGVDFSQVPTSPVKVEEPAPENNG